MDDCKWHFEKIYYFCKNLMFQTDPINSSCSQKLQYPERLVLFRKSGLQTLVTAIVIVKLSN